MTVNRQQIFKKLNEILDPELGISVVELGLIYGVTIRQGIVAILMTLTTPACPLGGIIEQKIKKKLTELSGIKTVRVSFTFDPPWGMDKISEETRAKLGLLT